MPELYEQRMLTDYLEQDFSAGCDKTKSYSIKEEMFIGEDFRFLLEYMKVAKISGFSCE